MKNVLSVLLFSLSVSAQDAVVPLVMYAEGPVRYEGAVGTGDLNEVYAGHHLAGGGALVLGESANVELMGGDQFIRLDGAGRYSVPELFGSPPAERGFLGQFLDFVRRGLEDSASGEDLERAYQANQGNAQGNISGLGDGGLVGLYPFGGTVGGEVLRFSWPAESEATSYRLRIVDSLSEAVVLEATARDSSLRIDLGGLQLADGTTYYWEVYPNLPARSAPTRLGVAAPAVAGTRIYFTYGAEDRESIRRPLTETEAYRQTHSAAVREVMTAMVYEKAGYLYAADGSYRAALETAPGNPLVLRTYAAFLSRWNQRSAARALLQRPE
jgi:hypothetical protein